ncbi:MAG: hypothetical protein GKR89_09240 [Candidatus Latescibacteria bacterium]|nr:hypothetical protein [Candidatus Latescibacterota bacterium]
MDIFNRLFNIIRAETGSDKEPAWETDEPFEAAPPPGPPPPNQDSELARCYAHLEIPYGSNLETSRRSWKRLLKKYHPDLHANNAEKRRIADQLTAELTRSFQVIEKSLQQK